MERQEYLERRNEAMMRRREREENGESSGLTVWSAVGGIALLGVAALVIVSLPDIKRYIKISTM